MSNIALTTISAELLPLTQTNYLNRLVREAIQPDYLWRKHSATDHENFPHRQGMPEVINVRGLMAPNLATHNVSAFSDPMGGMTVANSNTYEQYLGAWDRYDNLLYCDLHGDDFPIVSKFEENVISNAQKASLSADFLARNARYSTYTGGNTRVTANANASTGFISVDDIRGFVAPTGALGEVPTPTVLIGSNVYTLTSVVADTATGGTNVSGLTYIGEQAGSSILGVSGKLGFATAVAGSDAVVGAAVKAVNAPEMLRANNRAHYGLIQSGDMLTVKMIRTAVGKLNGNKAPKINGMYTLYADHHALEGLYQDPEWQNWFRGMGSSTELRDGEVGRLAGARIVEVTSAPLQLTSGGQLVSRPILIADGALTEFQATDRLTSNKGGSGPVHTMVEDNIGFVTRAPVDPMGQFVTQAYIMGLGYTARTDRLVTPAVIPTASNANYKRSLVMEVAAAS